MKPRWIIDHWLERLHVALTTDPPSAFELFLQELLTAYVEDDLPTALRLLATQDWKAYLWESMPHQLAQYWFLYGRIYERKGDYSQAVMAYQTCLDIFKTNLRKDTLGMVVVHFYLSQCEIDTHHYRAAYKSCTFVIDYLRAHKKVPLLNTNRESFLAINLLNRAKALPHIDPGTGAEVDLLEAFDLINDWVTRTAVKPSDGLVHFLSNDDAPFPMLLGLDDIPDATLNETDQAIINWAYLYNSVPWLYGYLILWRYIQDPANNNLHLQMSYILVVERAWQNIARLPSEHPQLPLMYNLGAEMKLALCRNFGVPHINLQPKINQDAEVIGATELLNETKNIIQAAKAKLLQLVKQHSLDVIGRQVPLMLRLSRLTCQFYSYLLLQPVDWFDDLYEMSRTIERHRLKCEKDKFIYLSGRYWLLKGRVLAHTGRKNEAMQAYDKALAIFQLGQGHALQIAEVEWAITELDTIPEIELEFESDDLEAIDPADDFADLDDYDGII